MSTRSESLKKYYKENPRGSKYATKREWLDSKKYYRLVNRYGISKTFYNCMIEAQNGLCAICDKHIQVVDHDHATNDIRGLLCNNCNWGLGNFMDNPENLIRAAAYLCADNKLLVKNIEYHANNDGTVYAEA